VKKQLNPIQIIREARNSAGPSQSTTKSQASATNIKLIKNYKSGKTKATGKQHQTTDWRSTLV